MRVLWFCNRAMGDVDAGSSGTWLDAMARGLLDSSAVAMGIIAPGPVVDFTRRDYRQVKQWQVPGKISLGRDGLPPATLVQAIVAAVKDFSPDLIHIWGTEAYWGLLSARGLLKYPSLLEIQGLKGQIAKVFYGDLTLPERLRSIGIKELLKRRTMRADRHDFARWGLCEEEMIRAQRFVDVQSSWVSAQVKAINPDARLFPVDLALREPFYDAEGWQSTGQSTVFYIAAYTFPFKGLHVAIRALHLLKKRIPAARLRIAGAHQRRGIRQDGYMRLINHMIRKLGLADAISWLGPISGVQIVTELRNASAIVIPSFVETYCTAMAEAMTVGTPVVVTSAGGLPSLGRDEESCLFFPPGDVAMCAYQLERVLTDEALTLRLSRESRKIATVRNDRQKIVERQLSIYRTIVNQL